MQQEQEKRLFDKMVELETNLSGVEGVISHQKRDE